jgi:transposase
MVADFLVRWPDLETLQKANLKTLRAFFYKHNSRSASKIEQRLAQVQNAKALTTDAAIILPARFMVVALASMLQPLHQALAHLEKHIAQTMDEHPDAPLFRSFPGAGPALAPRLLVAYGTNRDRFQDANEVAQLYGVAPVVIQSGNSRTVRLRHRCPKFGRQTFHENAACALKKEPWARSYYEEHKKRHFDKHHQACRALAYKLNRIYFACWKSGEKYDPNRYLKALKQNGSPLHKHPKIPTPTPCE